MTNLNDLKREELKHHLENAKESDCVMLSYIHPINQGLAVLQFGNPQLLAWVLAGLNTAFTANLLSGYQEIPNDA